MKARSGDRAIASATLGADRGGDAHDATGTRTAADLAMERYAAGEDDAFELVYDALADRVRGYLRRHVWDVQQCDDLVQETFLRMHRARGTFLTGGAVLPWAFAIARRLMLDQFRRDRRAPRVVSDAVPGPPPAVSPTGRPDQVIEAGELADRLAATLARLPDSQRAAFDLLKREGLTLAEAAAILGVTVTAVKLRAHRAYVSLRGTLRDHLGELPETSRS
jgi:RNA polymerase sigma-70 factor (ECF subfamily)